MARTTLRLVVGCACALSLTASVITARDQAGQTPAPTAQGAAAQDEAALVARARAIHDRVITLDTHNDISPSQFTADCNYTMRLTTQVNLPKMKEGGLDVSFMIVYVGQSNPPQVADAFQPSGYDRAYKAAVAKFDAVHHLTEEIAPNDIELALTAADVTRIGKVDLHVVLVAARPRAERAERLARYGDHPPATGAEFLHRGMADAAACAGQDQGPCVVETGRHIHHGRSYSASAAMARQILEAAPRTIRGG